jgi:hypothetical protein
MTDKPKERVIFDGRTTCPHCQKKIKLRIIKDILTPGVAAETQLRLMSEKDEQKELNGD